MSQVHGQAVWQGQFAAGSYGGSDAESIQRDELGNSKATAEWKSLQYRTFLRWTNHGLGKRALKIDDLEGGLQDGLMLHALLEVLSEKTIRGVQRRVRMRVQMINNHFVLFNFMKAEGLRIENIGPEDIVDRDTKLILGLIWILILRYTIGRHLHDEPGPSASPSPTAAVASTPDGSAAARSPAAKLLANLQNRLAAYPQIPVFLSLSAALADGRPLLGLVHSKRPDLAPLDFPATQTPAQRLERAFPALAGPFAAPLLLDPHDLASADDKSLMTFLSAVLDAVDAYQPHAPTKPNQVTQLLAPPAAEQPALSALDDLVNRKPLGTPSRDAAAPVDPALDNLISSLAARPALLPRPHPSPSAAHSTAAGPGLQRPSKDQPTSFTITARDSHGAQLPHGGASFHVAVCYAPSGSVQATPVPHDNADGTYLVNYTPRLAGEYEVRITLDGAHIRGSPFRFTVVDQSHDPSLNAIDNLIGGLAGQPAAAPKSAAPAHHDPSLNALDNLIGGLAGQPAAAPKSTAPAHHDPSLNALDNLIGGLAAQPAAAGKSAAPAGHHDPSLNALDNLIGGLAAQPAAAPKSTAPSTGHHDPSLNAIDNLIGGLAAQPTAAPKSAAPSTGHQDPSLSAIDNLIGGLAGQPAAASKSAAPSHGATAGHHDPSLNALDNLIGGLSAQPATAPKSAAPAHGAHTAPAHHDPSLNALDNLIGGLAGQPAAASKTTAPSAGHRDAQPTAAAKSTAPSTGHHDPSLNAIDNLIGGLAAQPTAAPKSAAPSTGHHDPSLNAIDNLIGGLAAQPTAAAKSAAPSTGHQDPSLSAIDNLIGGLAGQPAAASKSAGPSSIGGLAPPSSSHQQLSPRSSASSQQPSPRSASQPSPRSSGVQSGHPHGADDRDQFDDLQDTIDGSASLAHVSPFIRGIPANLRNFSDGLDSIDETESTPKQALRRFDPSAFLQILVQTIGTPVRAVVGHLEELGHASEAAALRNALSALLVAAKNLADVAAVTTSVAALAAARDQVVAEFPPLVDALQKALLVCQRQHDVGGSQPSPRTSGGSAHIAKLLDNPQQAAVDADAILKKIRELLENIKANMDSVTDINDFNELQGALAVVVQNTNKFVGQLNEGRLTSSTCANLAQSLLDLDRVWKKVSARASSDSRAPAASHEPSSAAHALERVFQNPAVIKANAEAIIAQLKQILVEAQVTRDGLDEPDAQRLIDAALQDYVVALNKFLAEIYGDVTQQTLDRLVAVLKSLEAALKQAQDMCRKTCSLCHKEILGGYAKVGSRTIHTSCFTCSVCKSTLSRYVEKDGRFYCPDHSPGTGLTCGACHKPITARYLEVEGKKMHPECLACSKCRGPISGRFFLLNDQMICEKCGSLN